jgi:hypothetical protein
LAVADLAVGFALAAVGVATALAADPVSRVTAQPRARKGVTKRRRLIARRLLE